jgi:hypothetical protein
MRDKSLNQLWEKLMSAYESYADEQDEDVFASSIAPSLRALAAEANARADCASTQEIGNRIRLPWTVELSCVEQGGDTIYGWLGQDGHCHACPNPHPMQARFGSELEAVTATIPDGWVGVARNYR